MQALNWYKEAAPAERRTFWGCFCGWTLDSFDNQVLSFLLPALMAAWHFSKTEAGLIATSSLLAAAVGGWISGILSDRHGRVRVLTGSIIWFTAFSVAAGFTTSYHQLLIVRALQGLGFGAEWAVGAALMAEVINPIHRGKALGLVQSGFSVGWALAAVITGLLLAYLPASIAWRSAFWVGVVPALVVLLIRRYIPEPEVFREMKKATGGAVVATWRSSFRRDVRRWSLLAALLVTGLQASSYAIMIWLPTMLIQVRHLPVSSVAMMATMMSVGSFIGQVGFAYLNDSFGRRFTAIAFCIFSASITACYLFVPMDPWMLALLGFPVGMGINGAFAGIGPMLSELFPTEIRTTCMGFSYNVGKSVGAMSVALVGAVAERMGMVGSIALFSFVGYFCALLALTFLPETRGRDLSNVVADNESLEQADLLEQVSATRR
ncbi:MFS transporter [Caballeronia sp. EK]|uniref:MFS transporter n=1 Tax=unclassified Caballeronia TaxID=2646786 RepID=UPI0016555E0D|nr:MULTISPECIES: MFS transporter [unclassified Caballeronia]MBC8641342.1 MFS transporter [Caballeronia sp. EK]BCQ28638.1 MFS transporter [Caballeronia sp. NK8]BCQ30182.1 MFS transporter [Caballeronia sp. NK8]